MYLGGQVSRKVDAESLTLAFLRLVTVKMSSTKTARKTPTPPTPNVGKQRQRMREGGIVIIPTSRIAELRVSSVDFFGGAFRFCIFFHFRRACVGECPAADDGHVIMILMIIMLSVVVSCCRRIKCCLPSRRVEKRVCKCHHV